MQLREQLFPHEWMQLSQELKNKFSETFGFGKSGTISVTDNRVDSDGYTVSDLSNITVEKMQVFTGSSETDFKKLLTLTIEKFNGKEKTKEQATDSGRDEKNGKSKRVSKVSKK